MQSNPSLRAPGVVAEEHSPHEPALKIDMAEIAQGAWEARHVKGVAAGLAGMLIAVTELTCISPTHARTPEEILPKLIRPMIDALAADGFDAGELFCGAGLDDTATDCELRLTPLFPSLEQARDAAVAMHRARWIVTSWRTDRSDGFRVVDAGPV